MALRFLYISSGIFFSYLIYAILQERLFKGVYGEEKEKFTYVFPVLFFSACFCYTYCLLFDALHPSKSDHHVPAKYYLLCAVSSGLAMASSFMSLRWVSYPTQIVAKAAKPIPVMVMGALIGHKVFPVKKYFIVLLIVFGVALFMWKDQKGNEFSADFGIGELLLLMSLTMDGIMNATQERILAKYSPSPNSLMLGTNKWVVLLLGVFIGLSGEALECLSFVVRHPEVFWHIALLCTTSVCGQFFIYKCISEFGTLPCSIVTTTRKFFTVLGSVILFGNSLVLRQWLGVFCVFSGLFLDLYYGKARKAVA